MSALSAGTIYRQVVIDPHNNKLVVASRYLWFIARSRNDKITDLSDFEKLFAEDLDWIAPL